MCCAIDGRIQKWTLYCHTNSLCCLFVTLGCTDTDMSKTLVLHNSLDICEIQIDQSRQIDQVCNTLYCLL